jgi:uncharacterized protein (DUF1778 family)
MTRLVDQVAFRVTPAERRLIARASRISKRSMSEWARMVITMEAEIQVQSRGSLFPPELRASGGRPPADS